MCGRYALANTLKELAAYFAGAPAHDGLWTWEPNWNLAPGVVAPVIALNGQGERAIVPMRWGLHPHWRKEMPEGRPLFNARVETAFEKASFRTPWIRRRALVPVSGWYEWEGVTSPKTPFYIHPKQEGLSALAGLWDQWHVDEGITLLSFYHFDHICGRPDQTFTSPHARALAREPVAELARPECEGGADNRKYARQ